MRQAIVTKYHGPTDKRYSRISATATARRKYVDYDQGLSVDANHKRAAEALATSLGWKGEWYGGGMPNDTGYVFVCRTDFETAEFAID